VAEVVWINVGFALCVYGVNKASLGHHGGRPIR